MLYKLITPQEFIPLLKQTTNANRVIPIDATWYLPNLGRNGKQEFLTQERIPGAIFFDIDAIKDVDSLYPHMAPTRDIFKRAMDQFGVLPNDTLVVYDRIGNFSAPRVAWTLSLFGHGDVRLLNNFQLYKQLKGPLEHTIVTELSPYPSTDKYEIGTDRLHNEIVSFDEMMQGVASNTFNKGNIQLFDARANGRFRGVDPEPRPGLTSGHVPGAQSLPFTGLLDPETKQFPQDPQTMKQLIIENISKWNGKTPEQVAKDLESNQIVTMCGTGVTGSIIKTAFELAGYENIKLYDGSWTEWALRNGNDSPLIAKE